MLFFLFVTTHKIKKKPKAFGFLYKAPQTHNWAADVAVYDYAKG